jgi:CRISPR-associated endonuclease/helicase Cas3
MARRSPLEALSKAMVHITHLRSSFPCKAWKILSCMDEVLDAFKEQDKEQFPFYLLFSEVDALASAVRNEYDDMDTEVDRQDSAFELVLSLDHRVRFSLEFIVINKVFESVERRYERIDTVLPPENYSLRGLLATISAQDIGALTMQRIESSINSFDRTDYKSALRDSAEAGEALFALYRQRMRGLGCDAGQKEQGSALGCIRKWMSDPKNADTEGVPFARSGRIEWFLLLMFETLHYLRNAVSHPSLGDGRTPSEMAMRAARTVSPDTTGCPPWTMPRSPDSRRTAYGHRSLGGSGMTFTVQAYHLPTINHPGSRFPLYPHQVRVLEAWDKHSSILLTAGTGTGKTRAAMLPVLKGVSSALAVYPTNELLRDQVRAVAEFSCQEGYDAFVWTPEGEAPGDSATRYSAADHILLALDRILLDRWQQVWRCRSRGETLRRLLNPDKPKIVFTNPDILFLILGLRYHAEPFEALRRYETLVVDEFHLYAGVELAHALAMVALSRGFDIFRRVILLSATPHREVQSLLSRAFNPEPISAAHQPSANQRIAVHAVEVTPLVGGGADPVDQLVSQITPLRATLERLRCENPAETYIPGVVIVNSVVNAIRLEDRLVESGFVRESLAVIRGLSHRAIRQTKHKLLALGTSAIEVGVDFHCNYLLFEASDDASFLQRFGRVGRHMAGKVIAIVPPNVLAGMDSLLPTLERSAFEEKVHTWYPSPSAYAWFVTTEDGMITIRALAENLIATVERSADSTPELVSQLRKRLDAIVAGHAWRLGCEPENEKARTYFERSRAGKKYWHWLNTYRALNRFRTSMPTVKVHDFSEQHRRQDWQMGDYEVDLLTLLKRAVGLTWNQELEMLTVQGIGKYQRVHASDLFDDDDVGQMHETKEYATLSLNQDGRLTPVSDLMARENHIFTVVPKNEVETQIDWRLPTFEAGRYLLAFDGAALLLRSAWERLQRQRNPIRN